MWTLQVTAVALHIVTIRAERHGLRCERLADLRMLVSISLCRWCNIYWRYLSDCCWNPRIWPVWYESADALLSVKAAEALSQVLRGSSALKEVDVSSNELGVDGGRMLREAVAESR